MREVSIPQRIALEAISKVTTQVRTNLLERNGIENLRILSESRFLELLKSLEAGSRRPSVERPNLSTSVPSSPDEGEACDMERLYTEKWTQLRSQHEESLTRIEGRMEKLARAFQGIQGVVEKLQTPEGQLTGSPSPVAQARPADNLKQKALLRQMLLTGDET